MSVNTRTQAAKGAAIASALILAFVLAVLHAFDELSMADLWAVPVALIGGFVFFFRWLRKG